jgi:hypothetical protein
MQQALDPVTISGMLSSHNISIETLVPLFLTAQNKNQDDVIQIMLDYVQSKPDLPTQLMTLTRDHYDNNGDNLAITLAKKLNDPSLTNQFITITEKYITEQTNQVFKKNLQHQLSSIKKTFETAISTSKQKSTQTESPQDNWLITFDIVNKIATNEYYKMIQHMMANQDQILVAHVGDENQAITDIYKHLAHNQQVKLIDKDQASNGSVDVLIAPYTLHAQMDTLFNASQDLLRKQDSMSVKVHPLFNYFEKLSDNGIFIATLCSGPTIQDFTNLILGKHNLKLSPTDAFDDPSLKIFNNVETFFRCLDIFKKYYEQATGNIIACDLSFSFTPIPLDVFCKRYVAEYPEFISMSPTEQEKFIRLLSVFNIGNDILDLSITLKMSIQKKKSSSPRSFKPIDVKIETSKEDISNEISLGQQNLYKQIQNLSGSELSMPYIKDADGFAQRASLQPILGREKLNFVELGGGRGETNAVLKAVKDAGSEIQLLNIEPHEPFAKPYMDAHHVVGIPNVQVMQKTAQSVTVSDIINHYSGKKIDALFASHAFYFLLGDLHKASQNYSMPLNQHPLWKYFRMLRDDGVFVITLQSGAGARLFRNALLGTHGLNAPTTPVADETTSLLSSFGNMATLLRSLELFAQRYKQETGKTISIKMHYGVANVPLGGFIVEKSSETQGFEIHNPRGDDIEADWLAPKMMDFYGNWKEQQTLATLTPEKGETMSPEDLNKLGIQEPTEEGIKSKRDLAIKTQSTFLHILPVFAPAQVNMQHPNITLEITVK